MSRWTGTLDRAVLAVLAVHVMALVLLGPVPASAHRVNVYAYLENGKIVGEGYFSNGNRAQECEVEVRDADGQSIGTARTDGQGRFSLALPAGARPPLGIVLRAGEGHQAMFALKTTIPGQLGLSGPGEQAPAVPAPGAGLGVARDPDSGEIERIVDRVVSERLAPLSAQIAQLAERQDRVTVRDIVGGLGWFVGLFGVAAYRAGKRG